MSFQEHEKKHIEENVKRKLTDTELQILAAEWSEHCSYKSSKKHLRMLPTTGPNVIVEKGYDSVASFCQTRTHPDKAWKIEGDSLCSYVDNANPWTTRQELSPAYELTGEVYAFDLDALEVGCPSLMVGRCAPLVVDADLSIDINSNRDLDLARLMFDKSPLAKFV